MRILVVDDLSLMRRALATSLRAVPGFDVVGQAESGPEAIKLAQRERPDVVLLDLFIPGTDVSRTLIELLKLRNTKVLVMAPADDAGAEAARMAMANGASDFVVKRRRQGGLSLHEVMIQKLQAMDASPRESTRPEPAPSPNIDASRFGLICIGASTGGPPILETILSGLPDNFDVPIVVAQHMPASFTGSLAARLNRVCTATIEHLGEASQQLKPGIVYVARGGKHLRLFDKGDKLIAQNVDEPETDLFRPSVSLLFESAAATHLGSRTLGVVLTGIGDDGLRGARAIKRIGGTIVAQDEASCVVYGMPRVVTSEGLADAVLTPAEIARLLHDLISGVRHAA